MKKILSFLVMGTVAVLPLTVSAASEIKPVCGAFDADGIRTCTVSYVIDKDTPQETVTVKLTEQGGAEITEVKGVSDSEFEIDNENRSENVYSVILKAPDAVAGEFSLLTFKYKKSGTEDCKVTVGIGDQDKNIIESDTPTDNVKTGSTLPYIALGAIAIIAGGAYLATKNKSKMYKI